MSGLYGNMMTYFQGQFIDLENFDMLPLVNDDYDTTKDRVEENSEIVKFRGCFQNVKGNETKDSNGNLVFVISGDLWSEIELKLGTFVKDPNETDIYRIMKNLGWSREGNFHKYDVVKIVGNDGTFTNDVIFNKGEDNFL